MWIHIASRVAERDTYLSRVEDLAEADTYPLSIIYFFYCHAALHTHEYLDFEAGPHHGPLQLWRVRSAPFAYQTLQRRNVRALLRSSRLLRLLVLPIDCHGQRHSGWGE